MDSQPIIIDDTGWDRIIKPFIIVNGSRLYLQDGYITNNSIKAKVEFFYQSENGIAHINFEEAVGAIKNGRVGIGDVNKNYELQYKELLPIKLCKIGDANKILSAASSVVSESGSTFKKLNKEVRLTYEKHPGINSISRPMPKSKKSIKELTITPDVIEYIGNFAEKNNYFIQHNGQTNVANRYEEDDDNYLRVFLYKLQPVVEIETVDLNKLKRKYNSENINYRQSELRTNRMNNSSVNNPICELKEINKNKFRTKSDKKQKRDHISSSDEDASMANMSKKVMDDTMNTSQVTKSPVRGNADSSKDSVYLESSEEESELETTMRMNFRKNQSKTVHKDNRSYSVGEDRAIINYVLKSRFLPQINGNVLWKELEKEYQQLTNRYRSWHSLRNRFLKSIRLNLREYNLSMNEVIELQMATFKGTLKKPTPAIVLPSVITAHSRKHHKKVPSKGADREKPDKIQGAKTVSGRLSEAISTIDTIDASTPIDKAMKRKDDPTYTNIIKEFEAQQTKEMDSDSDHQSDRQDPKEKRQHSGVNFKSYLKKGSRKLFSQRK